MIDELNLCIWGRDFTLPVEYLYYKGQTVTDEQIAAVKSFPLKKALIQDSKKAVEEFCRDQVMADDGNVKKDNIFSYIKPDYLYVKRDEKCPRVAIMCKYRYDPEHGIAVVFSADGDIKVGLQDIIL